MSTYDITAGLADSNFCRQTWDYAVSRVVDFSKVTTTGGTGVAADIIKVIPIAANTILTGIMVKVVTASTTGSSTFAVGDSSTDNGYMTVTTGVATSAANTILQPDGSYIVSSFATTPAVNNVVTKLGKWYTAADALAVKLGATAPLNGQVQIVAFFSQIL